MWCGVFGPSRVKDIQDNLRPLLDRVRRRGEPAFFESSAAVLMSGGYFPEPAAGSRSFRWVSDDGKSGLVWNGEMYGAVPRRQAVAQSLWNGYENQGTASFGGVNGAFTLALWDGREARGVLAGDHLGILPVYYAVDGNGLMFGSIPELVLHLSGVQAEPNREILAKILTFNYNPGFDTLYSGVHRLRPGHALVFHAGNASVEPYWNLRFDPSEPGSEAELTEEVRRRLAGSVAVRFASERRTGVFLSGGLDSSSVVSLLSQISSSPLRTFSFRCKGESFDESHYAKIVADAFGTRHTLVEYGPEDLRLLDEMVQHMDEPFCDAGINIATFLLARSASGQVDDLFTGDGGDELFAGHPVYAADRAARMFRAVPGFLRNPLFALGRRLSDSERKKDWKVKVKRFSASYAFPDALGTHRWRAYYRPQDLKALFVAGIWEERFADACFEDVVGFNREVDSPDSLARSLYTDYWTVVHFYLRRMGLTRPFGLRPKFPLLDPELVAFCAGIPSRFKMRGMDNMKIIEKRAVQSLLPEAIVFRKDKLGHSIPMKNWMRDDSGVRDFMEDVLSDASIKRRGLFRPERIRAMIREHRERRENHAHRLWTLMVVERWMQAHLDRTGTTELGGGVS